MNECTVISLRDLFADDNAQLIDVREPAEFAGGRVAGSRNIPLGQIEQRAGEIGRSEQIYVICRTGRRSAEAQAKLSRLGFDRVTNVAGGIEAWKNEKLPVERDEHAPWPIERQVRFTAGLLVLAGVLLSLLVHPYFIVLPGLIGFGLAFTAVIDWCGMGMLLAKMPWNNRSV